MQDAVHRALSQSGQQHADQDHDDRNDDKYSTIVTALFFMPDTSKEKAVEVRQPLWLSPLYRKSVVDFTSLLALVSTFCPRVDDASL